MSKSAIIIGAGVGGIATGLLLAKQGYKVDIFEKNAYAGGRCSGFVKDGHRFDAGATMLMMPYEFEDFFASIGKSFRNEIDLIRMNPAYRIFFPDNVKIDFSADLVNLKPQLEAVEKNGYVKFLKYMRKSSSAFRSAMKHFVYKNYYSIFDMINLRNLFLIPKIKAYTSYSRAVGGFYKSSALRTAFTLQSLYLGLNPSQTTGVFFALSEMELSDGVWFPKGGMKQIIERFLIIADEFGIKMHLNSPVKEIKTGKNKANGILLGDDSYVEGDVLVVNADLPYTYNNLLTGDPYRKKVNRMDYSCSALVFHWALDTVYPQLEQHNVFISKEHKEYLNAVFKNGQFPEEPTFYLHSPVQNDPSAAPPGNDSISAVVPIMNKGNDKINWEELKVSVRKGIIKRLGSEGINDIEKHIKFETVFSPDDWQSVFNLTKGSTFGSLSHKLLQMGYFRPQNHHRKYKNLFFAGASTHPGNGVPMTLISAKLTTERITKNFC